MNKELDKQLCEKYPSIFQNRHVDMKTTAMCWGFECDDGWYELLNQLCANIQHHIDSNRKNIEWAIKYNANPQNASRQQIVPDEVYQVVADQVKEKFGTLRFYYSGGDAAIDGMVSMAESMSSVLCEKCGSPGKQNDGPWIRTLCEVHTE